MLLLFQAAATEEPPVEPPAPVPTAVFLPPIAFGRRPYLVNGKTRWLTDEEWKKLLEPLPTTKKKKAKRLKKVTLKSVSEPAKVQTVEPEVIQDDPWDEEEEIELLLLAA